MSDARGERATASNDGIGHGDHDLMNSDINELDQPKAIVAAIILGFAGTGVAMGMPMLVGSLAESLSFNEQQLGWLASSDMGGLFIGSFATALVVARANRRTLAYGGLFLVILSNFFSTQNQELLPLVLCRLGAGVGAGICYSTCTASLAGSHNSARTFSIFLFVLVTMNALIFYVFPMLDARWGVNGIFAFYLIEAIPILFVIPMLPRYFSAPSDEEAKSEDTTELVSKASVPLILPRLCLAAVFSFYIMVGAYWAFIERAGSAANISPEFVSGSLTWSQVFSLSAAFLAVILAKRFGQSKPLIFSLLAISLTMLMLAAQVDSATFVISVFSFSFFWIFIDVFQLGTLSNIDPSGRYAALVPAWQGVAQAIAPSIAGTLLAYQMGYGAVMTLCAAASAIAAAIYLHVYRELLKTSPELANAS